MGGGEQSKINRVSGHVDSRLAVALESEGYEELFNLFSALSPSQIDHEIRSLSFADPTNNFLKKFLTHIASKLETKTDYELANAYLSIFLNIHEQVILEPNSSHEQAQ